MCRLLLQVGSLILLGLPIPTPSLPTLPPLTSPTPAVTAPPGISTPPPQATSQPPPAGVQPSQGSISPAASPRPAPAIPRILPIPLEGSRVSVEVLVWLALAAVGLVFAAFVLHRAYVNWVYQSVEARSLQARIARAHLRRATIKTICQVLFLASGILALLSPPGIRPQVSLEQHLLGLIFISVAALLDVDLYLDWRLQRLMTRSLVRT